MKSIGMIFKEYRVQHNLTLEEMGLKLSVSKSFVCSIEKNNKYPSLKTLKYFKEVFKPSNEDWKIIEQSNEKVKEPRKLQHELFEVKEENKKLQKKLNEFYSIQLRMNENSPLAKQAKIKNRLVKMHEEVEKAKSELDILLYENSDKVLEGLQSAIKVTINRFEGHINYLKKYLNRGEVIDFDETEQDYLNQREAEEQALFEMHQEQEQEEQEYLNQREAEEQALFEMHQEQKQEEQEYLNQREAEEQALFEMHQEQEEEPEFDGEYGYDEEVE